VLLTSTRKYRYKMAPSRAETKYKSTMALANGAEGAVRKRPGKEPGRAQTGAHCPQRLVSDRAKHRNRHQTMNHQQRDPHHARRWVQECDKRQRRAPHCSGCPSCSGRTPQRSRMIAALGRKRLSDFGLLSGFNIDQGATVPFFRSFWGDVMERYESSGTGGRSAGLEVYAVGDERQRLVKGDPLIKAVPLAGVPMV
jgi:hypothetical protein